jgi:trimethylamine--corrinoid protein Co-methyltransferase
VKQSAARSTHVSVAPRLRILDDAACERVYRATLTCLERTGVRVLHAEGRALLAAAGAAVDGERVRIPGAVIEDALAAVPRAFTLYGRDGDLSHALHVESGQVYFGPGPTCTYFSDPQTGERRRPCRGDAATVARVCDTLPNIDFVMGLGLLDDVAAHHAPVFEFAELIANTVKPVLAWAYGPDNLEVIYRLALAAAGTDPADMAARPRFALFANVLPPLSHTVEDTANVFWAAEHDVPVIYLGAGSPAASAPVTGAGALVVNLAGVFSGLAMAQLKRRGAAVCLGATPEPMDLRSARSAYGAPEMSLYSAALCDVVRWLGLPFMGTSGASDAKTLDLQAAVESTAQVLLSGFSGATLVHDVGFLDSGDIGSPGMLVLTDEIIGMARRMLRGMAVTDETLALDLIDQIGPGGEFMSAPETARRCRTELWTSRLFERDVYANWQAAGEKTLADRVQARVMALANGHAAAPLPAGAAEQMGTILASLEGYLPGSR